MIAELLAALAVAVPSAEQPSCAVTAPTSPSRRYGTSVLWTTLPENGIIRAQLRPGGRLFWKLSWTPRRHYLGGLVVRGTRLDAAAAPMTVLGARWGYSSFGRGGWATAVTFPTEGCWRLTGRTAGVKLSYVVKVVPE